MNIKKRDDGHREKNIEKTITNVIVLEVKIIVDGGHMAAADVDCRPV